MESMRIEEKESLVQCLDPVEVADGEFPVHDAAVMLHVMIKNIADAGNARTASDELRKYEFILVDFADWVSEIIPNRAPVKLVPSYDMFPA